MSQTYTPHFALQRNSYENQLLKVPFTCPKISLEKYHPHIRTKLLESKYKQHKALNKLRRPSKQSDEGGDYTYVIIFTII